MRIRMAVPADAPSIAAVHAASWRFAYRGALSEDFLAGDIVSDRNSLWSQRFHSPPHNQYVVVAESNGQLLGFACAYLQSDAEWGTLLDNIHVVQAAQRIGVGRQLMFRVAEWCAYTAPQQGFFLWVLQANTQAQRFYESLGASNVGKGIWVPPGGGAVPRFRYAWRNIESLASQSAPVDGLTSASLRQARS